MRRACADPKICIQILALVRDYGEFYVNDHMRVIPSKPLELPPEVAQAFVRDMRAFFAAGGTGAKADAVAAEPLHMLKQHYKGELKLHDVKEMFVQMIFGMAAYCVPQLRFGQ
jgi:hypothetical protein